jgi:hypothetical protein
MKVTMIIGEPAVGKSRLMREILDRLAPTTFHKIPYVVWHQSVDGTIVLGNYSDTTHKYPGTDRMSMACQPKVIEQLFRWRNAGIKSVIFEGDRLGNDTMIKSLQHMGVDLEVVCLISTQLHKRQGERLDQSLAFHRSRRTKIRNMTGPEGRLARSGGKIKMLIHDFPSETVFHAGNILRERK